MAVAITLTDSAEDATNQTTYTFTNRAIGVAADDRDVVVGLYWGSVNALTVSSATIAGTAATIDVQQGTNGSTIQAGVALIRLRAPAGIAGTTATIAFTLSGTASNAAIDVYRVTGANTALAASDGAQGTTTQSINLDIPADGAAIGTAGVADAGGAGTFTWTGLTEDTDRTVEGANFVYSSAHDEFATTQSALQIIAGASGGGTTGLSLVGISFGLTVEAVATASGAATVDGASTATASAVAMAAGAATVSGVGAAIIPAVASASGTATVSGVGFGGLRPAVGSAAGTSTATGVASLQHIVNTVTIQKPVNAVLAGQQRMTPGNPGGMSKALLKSIFRE